jgi:hypothetical protein
MMIDPQTHLLLHRQQQTERDRHLGHRAAIRATAATADAIPATSPPTASPWRQLLRAGRWHTARGSPTS